MSEGIEIRRTPSLANDQPYIAEGAGVRVADVVDRVRAGDSLEVVARDFNLRLESVRLLMEVVDGSAPETSVLEELAGEFEKRGAGEHSLWTTANRGGDMEGRLVHGSARDAHREDAAFVRSKLPTQQVEEGEDA